MYFSGMEQFVVSARKYRPKQFEDVVGQQHVTETLQKAIEQNHLAQALLFTGPRGVGKTTCARILARMINADQAEADQDFAFNIFELDAASNNGVDDIRSLTDQVRYPPQTGKFKVYIIDEVHMLSTAAFNAFLKTLEEPPAHAIFILATTEKHKLIPTILSRCQIYDFRRIGVDDIAGHLAGVAQKEGIAAESSALHLIAQKADGALRDALSIFDRIATYSGSSMRYQDVVKNLQLLDHDFFFKAFDLMLEGNSKELLLLLDRVLALGFDSHQFLLGMAAHSRDLLVAKDPSTAALIELGAELKARYVEQAKRMEWSALVDSIDRLNEADTRYRASANKRLLTELCLLKLSELLGQKKNDSSGLSRDPSAADVSNSSTAPSSASPARVAPNAQVSGAPAASEHTIPQAESLAEGDEKPNSAQNLSEPPADRSDQPSEKQEQRRPGDQAVGPEELPLNEDQNRIQSATTLQNPAPAAAQIQTAARETPATRSSSRFGYSLDYKPETLQNEAVESEEEVHDLLPETAFEIKAIEGWWEEFAATQADKPTLHSALLARKPEREPEKGHLLLRVPSKLSEQLIRECQAGLLGFLREKSKVENLRLTVTVDADELSHKPYGSEEVYTHLIKQFPELEKLREALDLDF